MAIEVAGPVAGAHAQCSSLLRRWLRETHTSVRPGTLTLRAGASLVTTRVRRCSPSGAHVFGPIHVAEPDRSDGAERTGGDSGAEWSVDPRVLAEALAVEARARASTGAAVHAVDASTAAAAVLPRGTGPHGNPDLLGDHGRHPELHALLAEHAANPPRLLETVTDHSSAVKWLDDYVGDRFLAEAGNLPEDGTGTLAAMLNREAIDAIGVLARHGVADEAALLAELDALLRSACAERPDLAAVIEPLSSRATLPDHAVLNGSDLRYRPHGPDELRVCPVPFESPNPLRAPLDTGVPGVPLPDPGGPLSLRPVTVHGPAGGADVRLVHRWMHAEHVAPNWEQAWSLPRWREELAGQLAGGHSLPCIVGRDGRQLAYVELYRVVRDALADCYPCEPHDLGVHIAVGEPEATGRGFGSALLRALAEGLLAADPRCGRVVAEPNVHNAASIGAFSKAGYVHSGEVALPEKNSALMVFSRHGPPAGTADPVAL